MGYLIVFLDTLLWVLSIAIIGRSLISWFDPAGRTRIARILIEVTEPIVRPIRQIIIDFQGWPVPVDAPDPRYFALHKLWLGRQSTRSAAKRPKDQRQGAALLRVIKDHMPHYPLDVEFLNALPQDLRSEFEMQSS